MYGYPVLLGHQENSLPEEVNEMALKTYKPQEHIEKLAAAHNALKEAQALLTEAVAISEYYGDDEKYYIMQIQTLLDGDEPGEGCGLEGLIDAYVKEVTR
jgi:hypothetical protein